MSRRRQLTFIFALTLLISCIQLAAASAAQVEVSFIDPAGNDVEHVGEIQVLLSHMQADIVSEGTFIFTDAPTGSHSLEVLKDNDNIHTRAIYLEDQPVSLRVQLGWDDLPLRDGLEILIPNGSFEEPVTEDSAPSWARSGSNGPAQSSVSSDYAFEGTHSLRMTGEDFEKGIWVRSDKVPVTPGASYWTTVQVYAAKLGGPNPQLNLEFWNSDGERIDIQTSRSSGLLNEWEQVILLAKAPDNAVEASVFLYANTTYHGVLYWDDVRLMGP